MEVHQQLVQMLRDLNDDDAGHETPSSCHQVEPLLVLADVQSGGLQSLLRRLHEQTEQAVTNRVNQVL